MQKQLYIFLVFASLLFTGNIYATVGTGNQMPDIPRDSLTDALFVSFTARLDSAETYVRQGAYEKAVRMYASSFEELKRFGEQRRNHDGEYLAALYETSEKEERLAFLNETLPLKRRQNLLLIILCVSSAVMLALLVAFQVYRLRNIRLRASRKEDEARMMELENEQRMLETRLKTMEVEKYQKELLAESLLLNYKNKVLDDLRLFLVQNPELNNYRAAFETILNSDTAPGETTEFNTGVDEIHPAFYERLQHQAGNRLTSLDLEYCRMISMKMTSKEMAEILEVGPNTIRIGKHRLKQKLGLGKEEDLTGFIEKIATI